MWANTKASGGLIAVGIEKDGIVSGCTGLGPARLNEIEKAGKDYCPDCRSETSRIPVTNAKGLDDFVLLIRVPYREDKVVRTVSGEAFIRIGDEKKKLSEDEIRELQIDKRKLDLEREPAVDVKWPEDFDANLIDAFCDSVRAKWGD